MSMMPSIVDFLAPDADVVDDCTYSVSPEGLREMCAQDTLMDTGDLSAFPRSAQHCIHHVLLCAAQGYSMTEQEYKATRKNVTISQNSERRITSHILVLIPLPFFFSAENRDRNSTSFRLGVDSW